MPSIDLENTLIVDNIAALRNVSGILSSHKTASVTSYTSIADEGGGIFNWDSTSTETDNNGTIIQATGIVTGRWKRKFSGSVYVTWFGAKRDGTAVNDSAAFQAAINASTDVYIPDGYYNIGTTLNLKNSLTLSGNGNSVLNINSLVGLDGSSVSFVDLSGFKLTGTNTATIGIKLTNTTDVKINDILFNGTSISFTTAAIQLINSSSNNINDCTISNCDLRNIVGNGIQIFRNSGDLGPGSINIKIIDNNFNSITNYAINTDAGLIGNMSELLINSNTFINCSGAIKGSFLNSRISYNYFDNLVTSLTNNCHINISGAQRFKSLEIVDGYFRSSGNFCIDISTPTPSSTVIGESLIIKGNNFESANTAAVKVNWVNSLDFGPNKSSILSLSYANITGLKQFDSNSNKQNANVVFTNINYTVQPSDEYIFVTSSGHTITLPDANAFSLNAGKRYIIKSSFASGNTTINPVNSELIDGNSSLTLQATGCIVLVSAFNGSIYSWIATEGINLVTSSGSTVSPSDILQGGALTGQALIWNGTQWIPSTNFGAQNITTTGILNATSFNVVSGKITGLTAGFLSVDGLGNITSSAVAVTPGAANTALLTNGAGSATVWALISDINISNTAGINIAKFGQSGATAGQAIIWSGTVWAPSTNFIAQDLVTTGTISLGVGAHPGSGLIKTPNNSLIITSKNSSLSDITLLGWSDANTLNIGASSINTLNIDSLTSTIFRLNSLTYITLQSSLLSLLVPTIQFLSNVSSPLINQADNTASLATGATLSIVAQNTTGTNSTGGDLSFSSGTGTLSAGRVILKTGGIAKLITTTSFIQFTSYGVGILQTNSVGIISAGTISLTNITPGAANTVLTTNSAGSAVVWNQITNSNIATGANIDPGKFGNTTPAAVAGQALIWSGSAWLPSVGGHNNFIDRNLLTTGFISMGSFPAQSGNIRLSNNSNIIGRDISNTFDVTLIGIDNTNSVRIGNLSQSIILNPTGGGSIILRNGSQAFLDIFNSSTDCLAQIDNSCTAFFLRGTGANQSIIFRLSGSTPNGIFFDAADINFRSGNVIAKGRWNPNGLRIGDGAAATDKLEVVGNIKIDQAVTGAIIGYNRKISNSANGEDLTIQGQLRSVSSSVLSGSIIYAVGENGEGLLKATHKFNVSGNSMMLISNNGITIQASTAIGNSVGLVNGATAPSGGALLWSIPSSLQFDVSKPELLATNNDVIVSLLPSAATSAGVKTQIRTFTKCADFAGPSGTTNIIMVINLDQNSIHSLFGNNFHASGASLTVGAKATIMATQNSGTAAGGYAGMAVTYAYAFLAPPSYTITSISAGNGISGLNELWNNISGGHFFFTSSGPDLFLNAQITNPFFGFPARIHMVVELYINE
jgi:hypothetical protein